MSFMQIDTQAGKAALPVWGNSDGPRRAAASGEGKPREQAGTCPDGEGVWGPRLLRAGIMLQPITGWTPPSGSGDPEQPGGPRGHISSRGGKTPRSGGWGVAETGGWDANTRASVNS